MLWLLGNGIKIIVLLMPVFVLMPVFMVFLIPVVRMMLMAVDV